MRRWLLIVIGAVVILAITVVVIGSLLPAEHEVSRTLFLPASARRIWRSATQWRELPEWRSDVRKVRALEGRRGWVEIGDSGELPLAIVEARAPHDLVLEVASDDLPFSGTWTFAIQPVASGAGCRVTITERGRVANPLYRFASWALLDPRENVTTYLTDLAARFGEDAEFED